MMKKSCITYFTHGEKSAWVGTVTLFLRVSSIRLPPMMSLNIEPLSYKRWENFQSRQSGLQWATWWPTWYPSTILKNLNQFSWNLQFQNFLRNGEGRRHFKKWISKHSRRYNFKLFFNNGEDESSPLHFTSLHFDGSLEGAPNCTKKVQVGPNFVGWYFNDRWKLRRKCAHFGN